MAAPEDFGGGGLCVTGGGLSDTTGDLGVPRQDFI